MTAGTWAERLRVFQIAFVYTTRSMRMASAVHETGATVSWEGGKETMRIPRLHRVHRRRSCESKRPGQPTNRYITHPPRGRHNRNPGSCPLKSPGAPACVVFTWGSTYVSFTTNRKWLSLSRSKTRMVRAKAIEVLLHGCSGWTLRQEHYSKLRNVHQRFLLRIIGAQRERPARPPDNSLQPCSRDRYMWKHLRQPCAREDFWWVRTRSS